MSNVAIKVECLGKSYLVGHNAKQAESYTALRDVIVRNARNLIRKTRDMLTGRPIVQGDEVEEFWALRDVSFEIEHGDRVGIIGRNGAGKSTLLKILSRITEPSIGRVMINGRVASLLEVGTGFHPELTGRENIYLNGAILGMSRVDVRRKFDEIVDFAEIQQFLDTPVKRYSSGMYVRLAFAVAAHLEPDILIVDEVLAVGDAAFQKKCMNKMEDQQSSGRTVLFVSHNVGAISQLCNKIIRLDKGKVLNFTNDVSSALQEYIGVQEGTRASWKNTGSEYINGWFTPESFYLIDKHGKRVGQTGLMNSEEFYLCIEGGCQTEDPAIQVGVGIYTSEGNLICWSFSTDNLDNWIEIKKGFNVLRMKVPGWLLNEGVYRIDLGVALYHRQWICEPGKETPSLTVNITSGFNHSPYWTTRRPGLLAPSFIWSVSQ